MDRLNYFNPYQSKPGYHEDQLTRAFLVLLKHSFHAFAIFFDYCRSKHEILPDTEERPLCLTKFLEYGWEIDTQKGNPLIETNWLLSVLITDADLKVNSPVTSSERGARYDGIITFGSHLTLIIEIKPRSGNVWFGQLNPSRENLSEVTMVYKNPACLEWKEIIRQLNHLLNIPTLSGYERTMIGDFLSYLDHSFPFLNPYDSFHLCKGYPELIHRRIRKVLQSVVQDEERIKYHNRWGFYIETPYQEIKEIGLIFKNEDMEWRLELSMYFGNTQRQAISFYNCNPSISHLSEDKWEMYSDFHVAYRSSNLVWFEVNDLEHYLKFWKENVREIYQQKKEEVPAYFDWLVEERVIEFSEQEKEKLQYKFYDTAMPVLNICPGFGIIYVINGKDAEKWDKSDYLKKLISEKIKEGLKVIGKDGSDFLKNL